MNAIQQAAELVFFEGLPAGDAERKPRCVVGHQLHLSARGKIRIRRRILMRALDLNTYWLATTARFSKIC